MPQYNMPTIVPTTDTGTTLSNYLNSWTDAIVSSHSGTTAPTYKVAGTAWFNTTDKSWNVWNGADYAFRLSDSLRVDGSVGIGAAPATLDKLSVIGSPTGAKMSCIYGYSATATLSTSNLTAIIKAGFLGSVTNANSAYLYTGTTHGTSVFNVRGNGDLYAAGTGQFVGTCGIGVAPGNHQLNVTWDYSSSHSGVICNDKTTADATTDNKGAACFNSRIASSVANSTNKYHFTATTGGTTAYKFFIKANGETWGAGISAFAGNAITSDPRMKKDWRDGSHDLSELDNITTGHFKFIHHDDDLEHYGFDASTIPDECKYLTDQIVPEHDDLYYSDVEVTEELPLEADDDGYGDENVPQVKTVTRTERQRNDTPIDDAHRVVGVNVGSMLAKTVEHNKLLKAKLDDLETRLAALESN